MGRAFEPSKSAHNPDAGYLSAEMSQMRRQGPAQGRVGWRHSEGLARSPAHAAIRG